MRAVSVGWILLVASPAMGQSSDPLSTMAGWWDSAKGTVSSEAVKWQRELPPPVKAMWAKVQQLKPEDARRLVREAPATYKSLSKQSQNVLRQVRALNEDTSWPERLNLMIELWRIRGGLHIAALLEPENLSYATGMNTRQISKVRTDIERAISTLMKG